MAQLLAIEWDAREARMAVARTRGKELTVEHAFAVSLGTREEIATSESAVGPKIAEALQRLGLGRVETLVAVGRATIELRQLSVPPAPANELPEIVRFQALRQFTTLGEDWQLDFVQLAGGDADTINVLAAAISPDFVRQIRSTCEASNLVPRRIILRPFSAASLLRRHDRGSRQPCRLMVDLLTEEADLTVLDDDHLLLTRTVRLASTDDPESQARGLLGELRRTIAAANNQLGGRRVEKVILCGDGAEHAALKTLVEQELSLAVELFDPFFDIQLGPQLQARRPNHVGRFAPLLGLLLDEATGTSHAIDFLHPRKRVEKADNRRRNALIAATVAIACLAAVFLVWMQLGALDEEIASLQSQSAGMKAKLVEAEKWRKDAAEVQKFLDHNINWLDEMSWLSAKLPSADDMIVTELTLSTPVNPQGGTITIEGYTREETHFKQIEENLRTLDRAIQPGSKSHDLKRDKHKYGFKETVRIPPGPHKVEEPRSPDSKAGQSNPITPTTDSAAPKTSPTAPQPEVSTTPKKGGPGK